MNKVLINFPNTGEDYIYKEIVSNWNKTNIRVISETVFFNVGDICLSMKKVDFDSLWQNDVNVLRTILIVIKTFRNNEIIKDIYNILLDNFNKVSKSKY